MVKNTRFLIIPILVFVTTIVYSQNTLPATEIKTLDGQMVNLADIANEKRFTILSFWATWCSPCKKELDAIAEIYNDWLDTYDMQLVAISVDDTRALAKVKPMVAEKGWPYLVLTDANQSLMRDLHFQSVPYTVLLKDGEIIYTHNGYLPGDEDELEEKMAAAQ